MSIKFIKLSDAKGTIMLQGTASDVGKSMIVTALCRILSKNNKISPFKSWNMSLNSYVTNNGGEIGIAQALQARAAGEEPSVNMQPILVKPKGDGESQVIMKGKPLGDFNYSNTKNYVKKAKENIQEALNELLSEYEYIVMEGAGSPVEVNRKKEDLANMTTAKMLETPVILVTNIDRGGALASIVGTLKLMEPEERELVKGIIINKFRGDYDLLKPGIDFLEDYTGKPVVGVIPYIEDVRLPEEDSASLERKLKTDKNKIDIGIIKLPHMSNFTDFKSLEFEPDVNLKNIYQRKSLKKIDLIIIPGTKTTTKDLNYLKESGLDWAINSASNNGVPVIGICGGYQMMGQELVDQFNSEGKIKRIEGLGLLPVKTNFLPDKTTQQVKAEIHSKLPLLKGLNRVTISGYEIHMGKTNYIGNNKSVFTIRKRSEKDVNIKDGAFNEERNCFGTYIHGLFNNDKFRRQLLNNIRESKGLKKLTVKQSSYHRIMEEEFDRLANIISKNLDLDYIHKLLT